jgi:hypothetical protein
MSETNPHTGHNHSTGKRVAAGAALVGSVIATGAALGPDLIGNHQPTQAPDGHTLVLPDFAHAFPMPKPGQTVKVSRHQLQKQVSSTGSNAENQPQRPTVHEQEPHKKHRREAHRHKDSGNHDQAPDKPPVMPTPVPETSGPDDGGPETGNDSDTGYGNDNPETGYTSEELQNVSFENDVTPEESAVLKEYATNSNGCSGFLIKAADGTNLGERTAVHCNFLKKSGFRSTDANGKTTLNFNVAQVAKIGDSLDDLTTAGQLQEILIPADDDLTKDEAVATFAGHSMAETLQRAQETQMSEDEVEAIEPGRRFVVSGWAQDQDTRKGPLRRQENTAIALGTDTTTVSNGETIKVLWTGMKRNANKAACSPGSSGSSLIDIYNGKPVHVGTASVYVDMSAPGFEDRRKNFEEQFGVSLDGADFLCGFSFQLPKTEEGALTAEVISPPEFDKTPLGQAVNAHKQNFFDPNFNHNVIEGIVEISSVDSHGGPTYSLYKPTIHYDNNSGYVFLTERSADGTLVVEYFTPYQVETMLSVYKLDANTPLSIENLAGTVTPSPDPHGGYVINGEEISKQLDDNPAGSPDGRVDIGKDGQIEIKAPIDINADIAAAKEVVNAVDTHKTSLAGTLVIGNFDSGSMYVKNPLLVEGADGSVVAFYTVAGEPIASFYRNTEDLVVFSPEDTMAVHDTTGKLEFQLDTTKTTNGALVGPDGVPMAELLNSTPAFETLGNAFGVSYQDGKFVTTKLEMK